MFIGWIYMIKKIILSWKEDENKFVARAQFTLDLGDVYICALSMDLIKNSFVAVIFDCSQKQEEVKPSLAIWTPKDEVSLDVFDNEKENLEVRQ